MGGPMVGCTGRECTRSGAADRSVNGSRMPHAVRRVVPRLVRRLTAGAAVLAAVVAGPPVARAASAPQVDGAVERGKAYLYARQKNGNWEVVSKRKPGVKPPNDPSGLQYGGMTALATYALLSCGESPQDAHVKAAVEWLKHADIRGTYAIGLRAQVWGLLPQDPTVKRAMERDRELLLDGLRQKLKGEEATANGFFGYGQGMPDGQFDHSVSQFGVLGLWSLEQAGLEVDTKVWRQMDAAWRKQRQRDGAWCYVDKPFDEAAQGGGRKGNNTGIGGELLSMTAAGVATLFITQDYANVAARCDGNLKDPDITAGLQWVATHFDEIDGNPWSRTWEYYTLFGIARIGLASGYKYVGPTDWFAWGADRLLARQGPDGAWGGGVEMSFGDGSEPVDQGVYDTGFALLFLARGRAPILFNKLDYNVLAGKKSAPGNWNQRPRDVANLTRYVGRQSEAQLNWQIVDLQEKAADLLDAPILFVAGNQPLKLAPGDVAKLKSYVEQGGIILGHADCGNAGFADSFRKLAAAMFPGQTMHPLAADHPILADESFRKATMSPAPAVEALDNGVRVQMLLLPIGDPAKVWQVQEFPNIKRYPFGQLMLDVYQYATDNQRLPTKGDTYLVRRRADTQVDRTVKVARLSYAGNWDPEPAGWPRLANVVHNGRATDLDVQTVELGTGKLTKDFALADLTGTAAFTLSDVQRKELADYVAAGGTLLVDAAGGRQTFAAAAQQELAKAFPSAPNPLPVVAPASPVFAAGGPLGEVTYRRFAKQQLGKIDVPRLRGLDVNGRTAVFFSGEDIAAGLVGQQVDGIVGYSPATALSIAEHVVLYAAK